MEQKLEMLLSILSHRTNLLRTYPTPKPIKLFRSLSDGYLNYFDNEAISVKSFFA